MLNFTMSIEDALEMYCDEAPRCTETKNMKSSIYYNRYNRTYTVLFLDEDDIDYVVWVGDITNHVESLEVADTIREFLNPTQESQCLESKDLSTTLSKKTVLSSTKGKAVHCEVVYEMMAM